ncbi:hypothetical protein [Nonomuraea salmonea]|uniref:hypothetical protein n=1 Tax=Nonomuraea salmonea TaxID=46181 RepID=UPI0031E740F2
MRQAVSGIFLGTLVLAGCSATEDKPAAPAASAPSAPSAAETDRLRAALLPVPKGMSVAYGPETGAFGSLKSTQQGLEAVRQAKLQHPECAGAAQLDAAKTDVAKSPAAVIAFSAERGSISQAVVSLPKPDFPAALPEKCASYTADVGGHAGDVQDAHARHARQGRPVAGLPDDGGGRQAERADRLGDDQARHHDHVDARGRPAGQAQGPVRAREPRRPEPREGEPLRTHLWISRRAPGDLR